MPEVSLQRPGIHAVIGEFEAARMAEQVGCVRATTNNRFPLANEATREAAIVGLNPS
jgi:hypothetical protein